LFNYLKKHLHQVSVIVPSEYPDFLYWLPGNALVLNYEKEPSTSEQLIAEAEIIFCLDFNDIKRVEKLAPAINTSTAKKILIDHHLDPQNVFDISFSYSDAGSTCEIVYDLISALGDRNLIDKEIASCLYCGIMTDTNSFRYSSMKAVTHRTIAELMDAGAVNYKIHELVYDNSTESRMRLLGYSLYEKLTVLREYNTAYIALTEEEINRFDFKSGDTEGIVNYALGMSGIILGVFFSEREGMVKISFRSKGDFSVQELSSAYFGGGGHKNASGGFSREPLEKVIKKFLEILPLYKRQLKNDKDI
jgi:bifunctional oligoribonuclease and PAP phosphatase NrnA